MTDVLKRLGSSGMTTNGFAVPLDVPASGAPANRSRRRKGGKTAPGRHRAPMTLGFVHDGIVVDIGDNGTVELSVGGSDDDSVERDRMDGLGIVQADYSATLLTMASHDLRQPLQVIIGAVDILAQTIQGGRELIQLARVERAAKRLAEKLAQLVDALQLREAMAGDYCQPVPLDRVLEELALELAEPARLKGIALRILPGRVRVLSHSVLLSGMLRNLIRNAVEYTPPGGRVLVACRRRGGEVHIEVRDSGIGIAIEELALVFGAFHRADATRPDGLGLGLYIVKRAADFLGHRVEVRSRVGRGSCFAIAARAVADPDPRRFGFVCEVTP
jgi:two-component system phosphate regulon sensor histidine kinase PhoR